MSPMPENVLVHIERRDGKVSAASLRLISATRTLAAESGAAVHAVIAGHQVAEAAQEVAGAGHLLRRLGHLVARDHGVHGGARLGGERPGRADQAQRGCGDLSIAPLYMDQDVLGHGAH